MSTYIKESLKMFGLQLVFTFISLAFLGTFQFLIGNALGMVIYSICTAYIYLAMVYRFLWNYGKADEKNICVKNKNMNESLELNKFKGLLIGLYASIPNIIFFVIFLCSDAKNIHLFYRLTMSTFIGFIGQNPDNTNIISCIVCILLLPIVTFIGYYMGIKKISIKGSIITKIIYKKDSK